MPTALIISRHPEFAQTLAEQLQRELNIACQTAPELKEGEFNLLISNEEIKHPTLPVLLLPQAKAPYRLRELLAKVTGLLAAPEGEAVAFGAGLALHPRQKQLIHSPSGKACDLTDKEIQLLAQLIAASKNGMAKEELLKRVWGIDAALDTHTLETHIYRLRGKLRELVDAEMIEATEGGYAIQ